MAMAGFTLRGNRRRVNRQPGRRELERLRQRHPHRTAPKRVGEHINLWCRSTTNRRQVVEVRTFFEAQEVAFRTIKCPRGEISRRHQIFRPKRPGIHGMVLQGGGFDSFVIRTRVRPHAE